MTLSFPKYNVPVSVAAEQFGISSQTLINLCRQNRLPHARVGSQYRLCEADLAKLVQTPAGTTNVA